MSNINIELEDQGYYKKFGEELSEIINQDGDEFTDGECIDQIIEYLQANNLYVHRK